MPLLTVRDLSVAFETRDGIVRAVNGVTFALEAGTGARPPRRVGLRARASPCARSWGCTRRGRTRVAGEVLVKGRDVNRLDEARARGAARRRRLPRVPGADDRARSRLHDRPADRRRRSCSTASSTARPRAARPRAARSGAGAVARAVPGQLPARDLRGHAPARDDRDRARLRAGAPARRRADHRARRHRAGADPLAAARSAEAARPGRDLRHPRPRRGRGDRRRRRRDVRRAHRRAGARSASCSAAPRIRTPRA